MIKKLFRLIRNLIVTILWASLFMVCSAIWMRYFWNFNLLSIDDWKKISYFWNHGGVIKQQRDVLFSLNIIILPFLWFFILRKLIKFNYVNLLLAPFNLYNDWHLKKIKNEKVAVLKNISSIDTEVDEFKAKISAIKPKGAVEKNNIKNNLSAYLQKNLDENKNVE